ncbi:MAG TPA: glycosyltransferase [Candidatus Limiplasma sp.]|nr:glycosyltransferase [Candidatus Limiplasma sp.]
MNILFLTLLYPPEDVETITRLSRDGLQNQVNAFQWALIEGLKENIGERGTLSILNALPVGIFPTHYRKLWLANHASSEHYQELGGINLPGLKQRDRTRQAAQALEQWVNKSPENRTVLIYTLYLPYLLAVQAIKRRHPDLKATVIVTDLPNELGIASGRKGLLRKLEYRMGKRKNELCRKMDAFVLLTRQMAEVLPIEDKPRIVLEGLISPDMHLDSGQTDIPPDDRPTILYTGTLNRELGIGDLLEAFQEMPDVQLWLCGRGDMESEVSQVAATHDQIRYFGFVPRQTALALQMSATALINPRTAQGAFTRYSFPSKTLEYMQSGKPVLCCRLEGIPDEYDPYLRYIEPQTSAGIREAVRAVLALAPDERETIGERARSFVLEKKNSRAQSAKLLQFLRQITNL